MSDRKELDAQFEEALRQLIDLVARLVAKRQIHPSAPKSVKPASKPDKLPAAIDGAPPT